MPPSNFLNTGLWSICGVVRPDFCSDSTLSQGSVTTSGNCSDSSDLFGRISGQFNCNPEVFHPYLDVFLSIKMLINLCRVTDNDELCGVIMIPPNVTSYLYAVESHCQLNLTQECTQLC